MFHTCRIDLFIILILDHLVLDRLEVLLVELAEIHEHQLVVWLETEEHLGSLALHRLHVGRALGQLAAGEK